MLRRHSILGLSICLALLVAAVPATPAATAFGAYGGLGPSEQVYPVPLRSSDEDWVLTQSWGGTGDAKTEPFDVEAPQFLLEWQAWQTMTTSIAGVPGLGLLQVEVHRVDGDVDTTVATVSASALGQNNRLVESGAGRYYLRVVAPNLGWSLMVKEAR